MVATFDLANPHVIRTHDEYDLVVQEIDRLLDCDPAPGSKDAERLELLSILIEAFDRDHFTVGSLSSPQSIVQFVLDQQGRTRADLAAILGSKSRVSEFFSGKRKLSLSQIAALRKEFAIPADVLIEGETSGWPVTVAAAGTNREKSQSESMSEQLTALVAAQRAFVEQLANQFEAQTKVLSEALWTLNRVTTAHQYALEQYAAAASTVIQAAASSIGIGAGAPLSSLDPRGSNPASSARINLSGAQLSS